MGVAGLQLARRRNRRKKPDCGEEKRRLISADGDQKEREKR